MDSAEARQFTDQLRTQDVRISQQEGFQIQMGQLSAQVQSLIGFVQQLPQPAPETRSSIPTPVQVIPSVEAGIKLASPERYSEDPGRCKSFLIDCSIHFEHSPQACVSDRSKIAFMIAHLTGRAKAWATAEWSRNSPLCQSLPEFQSTLKRTFDPVSSDREKARELSDLRQGGGSVCDYAIRFWTLAAESGWNESALYDVFLKGLSMPVQERLVHLDLPPDLDSLISLTIRTDNRMQELKHQREDQRTSGGPQCRWVPVGRPAQCRDQEKPGPSTIEETEPMQLGRACLTSEERRRRQNEGRCFYCGENTHLVASCPAKSSKPVSTRSKSSSPHEHSLLWQSPTTGLK